METMTLYGEPGWGSVLIEAQFAWYGMSYAFEPVGNVFEDLDARAKLEKINPLGQVPTLVLADSSVMTESAAITLWLSEQTGSNELVPEPGSAERARFLRWLIFFTSNIYPTYTYADMPSRFVSQADAREGFAEAVGEYAKTLYAQLNGEAAAPWFLGARFSALDIYICTLTHWRPGRRWYEEHTPRLRKIADATLALPRLADVWARNYPKS